MSRKNKIQKTIMGSDGNEYRGKAVKARKRLEARIKDYENALSRDKSGIISKGFTKPGSMKI